MSLHTIRRAFMVSLALASASLIYSQESYQQVVTASSQGDKVFLEIHARHLQQSIDSIFYMLSPENIGASIDWSHVLNVENNPGMDVNFSAYDAYGIADLSATGTLNADSLVLGKDATIAGGLNVTGISTFGDDLTVSGYVSFNDSLEVVRAVSIGETLYVTGVTTLGDSLYVAGSVNMAQLLNVVGAATFGSTVSVSGAATLGSTLSVSGVATLSDSLIVGSGASVAGTLRADSIVVTDVIQGAVSSIANHTTDALSEGTSNLYFTTERAQDAVSLDVDSLYGLVEGLRSDMDSLHAGACTTINYNGYDYDLVEIGGECWFAENLQTTLYQDGTAIAMPWNTCGYGAEACFGDNDNFDDAHYGDFYTDGFVYTWFAVANTDNGGLCPSGYRVASSADWEALHANYDYDASSGWDLVSPPAPGLNTDGFNATLAGYVIEDPLFSWDPQAANYGDGGARNLEYGESGGWWTLAQVNATEATAHRVTKSDATATWASETFDKFAGFPVRCVAGTETLVTNLVADTLTASHVGVMSDSLYVGGNANLVGDVNIGSNVAVSGQTTLSDSLIVGSGASVAGTLRADSIVVTDVIQGAVSSIANHTTDALSEGTSNLYFTTERAQDAVSLDVDSLYGLVEGLRFDMDSLHAGNCTTINYNGYDYDLVEIGGECWFAENLQTTLYQDGTAIAMPWFNCGYGAEVCFGDNDNFDDAHYSDFYTDGFVYTWFAVANTDNGGLCPSGYRVATSADWEALHANYDYDASSGWDLVSPPAPGLNTDGFNATLAGYVIEDPLFSWDPQAAYYGDGGAKHLEYGESGGWWTLAQVNATEATAHRVTKSDATATWASETFDKFAGFPVRCVAGTETLVTNLVADTLTANHVGVMSDSLYVGGNANLVGDVNIGSSLVVNDTNVLAIIASLQAQIDALSGGTPAASTTPCADETTYTYHEVTYNLVELGDDCWFADDLQTENLNSGLVVQESTNHIMNSTNPWSVPRTHEYIDAGSGGHYYDYFALTSDALCPKGWHVPTIDDVNAAALDANFSSAFPNSEGGSWDYDHAIASPGTWAVSTSPSFGALTVFNNAGSASEMGGMNAGGKTRCVKD